MANILETPWPGIVQEITVAVGDEIQAGQEVLTIESMKMLTAIEATHTGRVAEIFVASGDYVELGDRLLSVE